MEWTSEIDQGLVRKKQEDSIQHWPKENPKLFILGDGLGGLSDGDIASSTAVKHIYETAEKQNGFKTVTGLKKAVQQSNNRLKEQNSSRPSESHMATTLTLAYFQDETIRFAHIGDSRIYRIRNNKIKQLTTDHSYDRHTLSQAIGLDSHLDIDAKKLKTNPGDVYLICSDGLYGMVMDETIIQEYNKNIDIKKYSKALLKHALENGGEDNISLFLIKI